MKKILFVSQFQKPVAFAMALAVPRLKAAKHAFLSRSSCKTGVLQLALVLLISFLFINCPDPGSSASRLYTTEYVHVYDSMGVDWGSHLHFFSRTLAGLDQVFSDLGYEVEPSIFQEIIVMDTTSTLSPNVTFAMGQKEAVFAGTFYYKNENGSFPFNPVTDDKGSIEDDIYFLLHVRVVNRFYSGVYKEVSLNKLEWYYYPDWIIPIGG